MADDNNKLPEGVTEAATFNVGELLRIIQEQGLKPEDDVIIGLRVAPDEDDEDDEDEVLIPGMNKAENPDPNLTASDDDDDGTQLDMYPVDEFDIVEDEETKKRGLLLIVDLTLDEEEEDEDDESDGTDEV